jgi:N-carbamoylputrescine amidase
MLAPMSAPSHLVRSPRRVTVAATQFSMSWDAAANLAAAEAAVREAARRGAGVVLLPELFETPYFCIEQDARHFALAKAIDDNPALARMRVLARELGVVLPVSVFERAHRAFFNTVAIVDADGSLLGTYRKSHIPNGPGYQEKQYFSPGDTGFRVWNSRAGCIGVGICWDQWFPETARAMALAGAELLLFPTAIGSEPPPAPALDSFAHWQRTQQGHAAANLMPLVAANRFGREVSLQDPQHLYIDFHGGSFIADGTGAVVAQAPRDRDAVLVHTFDLDALAAARESWGLFRDRRPELYGALATLDGRA